MDVFNYYLMAPVYLIMITILIINCLIRKHKDGKISYYKYVLECKLVVGNIVISLDSEFIKNKNKIVKLILLREWLNVLKSIILNTNSLLLEMVFMLLF